MRLREFIVEPTNSKKLYEVTQLGNIAAAPGAVPTKNKPLEKEVLHAGPPYPAKDTEAVKAMQRGLQQLGYDVGRTGVDGKYGPNTTKAVGAFKKDYKLQGDAVTFDSIALETLKKIQSGVVPKVTPTQITQTKVQPQTYNNNDSTVIKAVIGAGAGYTDVQTADGRSVRRSGARNWRNNNPGNLEYGQWARSYGAIGTDGRFAVFPTLDVGMQAKEGLVFGKNYINLSIRDAIEKYAPSIENNTNMYVSQITNATGANANTILRDLNPQQRKAMLDTITKVEGFKPGQEIALSSTSGTATA